ncbi:hypothetical protein FOMPIDRAFT_130368 [Fomitopsis schrenkii]|uniref:Major facilitator superfamily (MFS) profile domain-containing protein n=1 Tax=Fomitopsis schrenkii TaxID=2126942 RepID=S8DNS7_FOMSC|nr:hypothetical protein FOMPIDRAFT_130368 [Fomitopsis schrenkii]
MDVPDGGLWAWLAVVGGALVQFCTFGYASSFGVYQAYYVLQGGFSSADASWIGSLQFFLLFFMGLPAGKLFDAGYFRHMQVGGTLLYALSLFMLSLANPRSYYQIILSQGVGMGIGSGLLLVPAISVQAHHWKKHRSLAMGIVLAGTSCGGIVYPIMLNQLIHHSPAGFPWAVRATGFLSLALLIIASCIITTRMPPKVHTSEAQINFKAVLTDWSYLTTVAGAFLILWGLFFPYFYLQLWSTLHGNSSTFSFYSIAILNAGSIAGRLIPNALADVAGRFNVICPIAFVSTILLFSMFGVKSIAAVTVFAILYGFFSGAIASLFPPLVAGMARHPSEVGLRIGFAYFLVSFAILTGSPIDGALLGEQRHWANSIIFSGVVMLGGSIVLVLARYMFVRSRGFSMRDKL